MYRVIIVDDESLTLRHIGKLLKKTGRAQIIGEYTNPLEARAEIFSQKPDAVFLDIEMPELDGLQLAEEIYASDLDTDIVFITAYNEYAMEAFKVNAMDYLLKPISAEDLNRALNHLERRPLIKKNTAPVSTLIVQTLGRFEVRLSDHTEAVRWCTEKCAEIFAYFVLMDEDAPVSKWKLAEFLWPGSNPDKASINLRSTVCRLNKTLKEYGTSARIVSKRNGYALNAEHISVDALQLKTLAYDASATCAQNLSAYQAALQAYRGELLEQADFAWSAELREKYFRYFSMLAKKLTNYYINQNDLVLALDTVELWLQYDPYNEEAQSSALKLQNLSGGQSAGTRYYKKLIELYQKEFHMSVPPNIEKLYHSLS